MPINHGLTPAGRQRWRKSRFIAIIVLPFGYRLARIQLPPTRRICSHSVSFAEADRHMGRRRQSNRKHHSRDKSLKWGAEHERA